MSKYENAMKLMEERCGNGKEEVIALATISLSPSAAGNSRPAVRNYLDQHFCELFLEEGLARPAIYC